MSKIFEALRKAQGEASEIALPLIASAGSAPAGTPAHSPDPQEQPVESESAAPRIRFESIHLDLGAPVVAFSGGDQRAAEEYRMIRTKIVQHPKQPKLILISSANSGDGKTVTSINLAGVMALRDDANVLLVDADFRRSNVANALGISREPGLANVLSGDCDLQDAIVRVEQAQNLFVLPAGSGRSNPAELLDSPRWRAFCSSVRGSFHFTILDVPPVAAVADYELVQANCDGVILVARPDHTDRTLCLDAIEMAKEKLIGVVVNCAYDWFFARAKKPYRYGSAAYR